VAWSSLALSGREPFRRRAASGLAWWGLVAVMLEWHLGMIESQDGEPRSLGPADALTLVRAFLVPVIADDLDTAALTVAAVSDVLDGMAARATVPPAPDATSKDSSTLASWRQRWAAPIAPGG